MKDLTVILASITLFCLVGFSLGDNFAFRTLLEELGGNTRRSLNVRSDTSADNIGQIRQSRSRQLTIKPKALMQMNTPQMGMIEAPFKSKLSGGIKKEPIGQIFDMAKNSFTRNHIEVPKMNEPLKIYPVNQKLQPINLGLNPMTQPRIVKSRNSNTMTINSKLRPFAPFQVMPASISGVYSEGILINDEKRTVQNLQSNPKLLKPASTKIPTLSLMGHTVEELDVAANISVGIMQAAINMRQQQLMAKQEMETYQKLKDNEAKIPTTSTTSPKNYQYEGRKVMNAPQEYYPVGYLDNFDDHFTSKIDLPKTSFQCGVQKHFPGLYADEDLDCVVFHVCAINDGLIMKSFLCPKETLFDKTILKCNWWFYVDCKSSKPLYDSNIPVSRSYQLIKALTLFSKYKTNGRDGLDIEALKNAINRNSKPT